MKKRILALLLSVALCLGMLGTTAFATGNTPGGWLDEDGKTILIPVDDDSVKDGFFLVKDQNGSVILPGTVIEKDGQTFIQIKTDMDGFTGTVDIGNQVVTIGKKPDQPCEHEWGAWESAGDTQHQRTCGKCGDVETAPHTFGSDGKCTECGYEKAAHTHNWGAWKSLNSTQHQRTCVCGEKETENHKMVNGKCSVCGYTTTPPSHTHAPSSAWSSDADRHWHACACGEKFDYAAHTLTSTVTRYPTATTAGERTYSCPVCGYSYKESIPATGYPYQPDDPGAGGDGTPTPSAPTYSVSAPSSSAVKGGSVSLSSKNPSKGSTVTITVKPDSGYELDFITAVDASGNSVALTNAGGNKYTFVMPASKVTLDYAFKAVENTTPVEQPTQQPATPSMTFTDVPVGAYYAGAVAWAVEQGITTGTSATTFAPDAPCTRGQIVTFLWRAAGSPKASASNPFTDVKESDYWYDAVLWAVSEGITTGTTAAAFAPNDTCTRAHAVTFLYRASGSPAVSGSGSFTDVDAGAYYANAVQWAVANGITNGTSANTFGPNDTCTRGHIVTFLYRDRA